MTRVVAVIDDVFFLAKVQGTARQAGVALKTVKASAFDLATLRAEIPALVLIDLESTSANPVELISRLKSGEGLPDVPVVAFGRHVHADKLEAAEKAGADRVLPRSEFVTQLADILRDAAVTA